MAQLISKLSQELALHLGTADEVWIAVALMNMEGLNFVQKHLKKECTQNFLVGIDLPTHPEVLSSLYKQKIKSEVAVKIYSEKEYFHPKVYLVKKGYSMKGFIGSGNCTNGGLRSNIELTALIENQADCNDILDWFQKLYKKGKSLSVPFLNKYKVDYANKLKRKREDEELTKEEKKILNEESEAIFHEREKFIKVLKAYRKKASHNKIKKERNESVQAIRDALDYPHFKNPDIEEFFGYSSLGHLIAISKPKIIRETSKFKKLLAMLCDETVPVSQRYSLALKGRYKMEGAAEALISKVLTIHKPELYYVENSRTTNALKKFGIEFPRGMNIGDKYEITCNVLKQICKVTGIEDLTVLDYYLYLEGEKED